MLAMIIALALYRLTERANVPLWHPFAMIVQATQVFGRLRIVAQGFIVLAVGALQLLLLPYWASQVVSGLMLAAAFGVAGDLKRLVDGSSAQPGVMVASGTLPMLVSDHLVWRHVLPILMYSILGCIGLYWVMWMQTTRAPGARKLRWGLLWLVDYPVQWCLRLKAPYLLKGIATKLAGLSRENWVYTVMKMRTRLLVFCCTLLLALDIYQLMI
ncbi:hypothetical protein [Salinibius halmophilus]|uniref:hypothetical protein n=1 Tax=Salinibius halmophilus TaxID=1853216 RepID=UPI000E672D7D|nr:hypothetical protein [Salinibius halmophilus]